MADDVVKEKVKRTKKAPIQEEAVEDNSPAPIIDAETVKTAFGLFFLFVSIVLFVAFRIYLHGKMTKIK